MRLVSCEGCQRHVRATESACPFCGSTIDAPPEAPRTRSVKRLGRAALFAFGTSLALVGCDDDPNPVPAYGTPAVDAGPGPDDAGGGPAPAYGAAPADGG